MYLIGLLPFLTLGLVGALPTPYLPPGVLPLGLEPTPSSWSPPTDWLHFRPGTPTSTSGLEKRSAPFPCHIRGFHDRFCEPSVVPRDLEAAEDADSAAYVPLLVEMMGRPYGYPPNPLGYPHSCGPYASPMGRLCVPNSAFSAHKHKNTVAIPEREGENDSVVEPSPPISERSVPVAADVPAPQAEEEHEAAASPHPGVETSVLVRKTLSPFPHQPSSDWGLGSGVPSGPNDRKNPIWKLFSHYQPTNLAGEAGAAPAEPSTPSPAVEKREPKKKPHCDCTKATLEEAGEDCAEQCTGCPNGECPEGEGWGKVWKSV